MSVLSWNQFFVACGFDPPCSQHLSNLFDYHEIQFDMLNDLNHEILIQMGIRKAGHRIRILRMKKARKPHIQKEILSNTIKTHSRTVSTKSTIEVLPSLESTECSGPNPPIEANPHAELATLFVNSVPTPKVPRQRNISSTSNTSALTPLKPTTYTGTPSKGLATEGEGDANPRGSGIAYFFNDDLTKHRLQTNSNMTVGEFREEVMKKHKNKLTQEWAVFTTSQEEQKLVILKHDQLLIPGGIYYIIFNSNVQNITKKLQKKLKRDYDVTMQRTPDGRPVYTSDNHPIKVDYVPDEELYMSSMGRLGLCMAPGRTKKKQQHDWARDLSKDLDRIRDHYGCHVLVTLVRHAELRAIHTPNLFVEVEARGMDSIHFPIKDKYIPNSMEQFMVLIETVIQQLKYGKTIVVHCNGGKGRSGTVLVATLVALGRTVEQAIEIVRKARPGTIQNPLQIAYVKRFKTTWRKNKNKQTKEMEKKEAPKKPRKSTHDEIDAEDEKLNPEEKAAWNQHENKLQEDDDDEEESIVINPGKFQEANLPSNPVNVANQLPAPQGSLSSDSRNRSPSRYEGRKKEPPGIMSRIGIKVKPEKPEPKPEKVEKQDKQLQKNQKKQHKIQVAAERQARKIEQKNKARPAIKTSAPTNTDEASDDIEMIEIPEEAGSEEDLEIGRKVDKEKEKEKEKDKEKDKEKGEKDKEKETKLKSDSQPKKKIEGPLESLQNEDEEEDVL